MATIQDLGKVAYFNKGVYNSETSYEINDVVSYNGSSYVSLGNNNQGNLPTNATYWSVVALKGEKGDTGKPFVIEKTYESIEDMVADYDNMNVNDYVMIQGSIEDEENATLWTKTETEVSPYKWVYLADFSGASGITGQTPNIQIGTVTEGNEPAVTRRAGSSNENPILDFVLKTGAKGDTGATGNGISNVSKTGTSDLIDTYTITYTNGNSTTFDVSNGKGIVSIVKTGTSGLVDTYTITYNDGTTSTYTVTNGEDGEVTQAQLDETNSEVELLKKIYNAFPTTSGEDEIVTLNGTAEVNFKNIDLKGNTSQETTTGKNLFGGFTFSKTYNGVTFNYNKDGSITANGTASDDATSMMSYDARTNNYLTTLEAGTYTISGGDSNATIEVIKSDGTFIADVKTSETSKSFTVSTDTSVFVRIKIANGVTVNNITVYQMLEKSSTPTAYEPFTNGASPNPDYPQEVKVVTGNNTIKIDGKNLWDEDWHIGGISASGGDYNGSSVSIRTQSYIRIDGNKEYFITCPLSEKCYAFYYDRNKTLISSELCYFNSSRYATSITPNNTVYLRIAFASDYGNVYNNDIIIGYYSNGVATTYKPYTGHTYPINLGSMELCKIGDYQDRIYKQNDKWYLEKQIDKVVLNGSEDWLLQSINSYGIANFNRTINDFISISQTENYSKNDRFTPQNSLISETQTEGYLINDAKQLYVRISSNRANTVETFKAWLSNNNTTVYYVLSTPTTTEITDTTLIGQLNDLERAYSYEEQTTISQTNANKPFIITAEAILSLKDILNS